MELSRIMVFDRLDAYVCDLDPARILELRSVEEINGEHALTLTTTHQLDKTNRIVLNDGMGIWHEYVVTGIVDTHETDQGIVTEYYCVWSIQYDLSGTFVNDQYGCGVVPGHASVMHPARDGLTIALSTTTRWQIGTITVTSEAAASFYRRSGWEAIQTVLEKWGGELQATITVGQDGVESRAVDLLAHVGAESATRRFDYGHDVASIKRTVSEDVWPCRIVPLGASQETDEGGYTRRPTIESVNGGVMWLEDSEVVPYVRIPDGNGGWEYPTVIIENDTYEEPADLKAWALANISDYTRPKVTYEASVVQLTRAGMNAHGVALGDEVVIVDREFGGDGLRISARVVKQECNLLDPTDTTLTIGNATDSLSGQLSQLSKQLEEVSSQVASASVYQSTAAYLSRLLERLNAEANATGGFTYITEGEGIRTYNRAVSDPLVGAEASQVTDLRGGVIRFANTKDQSDDWVFRTLIESGLIATSFLSADNITVGKLQSADGNTWWDLDNNDLHTGVFWVLANGVLVARPNSTIGMFIDTSGSYDIVSLTWSGGVPTVGTSLSYVDSSSARIGKSNSNRVTVDTTNGVTIYKGNTKRLQTKTNGIEVYASDGSTSLASFGSTARIGDSAKTHVNIGSSAATFYDEDNVRCTYIGRSGVYLYDDNGDALIRMRKNSSGYAMIDGAGNIIELSSPNGDATFGVQYGSLYMNYNGSSGSYGIDVDSSGTAISGPVTNNNVTKSTTNITVNTTNATAYGSNNRCWHTGLAASAKIGVNLKAELNPGGTVEIGTVPDGYRPPFLTYGSVYITGVTSQPGVYAQITAAGVISISNRGTTAIPTTANVYCSFSYAT